MQPCETKPASGHEPLAPSAAEQGTVAPDPVPNAVFTWTTRLLLTYFGLRLVFLALSLSSFVPPDEVTHAGLCKVFSKVFLLPDNSPASYQFGLATNTPWLYYWTMGKLLHLNVFGLPDLVFLRLLNIPIAFGTVCYIVRLLDLFTSDRLTRLLVLTVATNTAMFTLLSASVSYDNLANLLAAMAIYYLLAFFKFRCGNLLAASLLCQLAGSLTKITFLPLALLLGSLLLAHELKSLRSFPAALTWYLKRADWRSGLLGLALLLALGLNLQLYAGNYLRFGGVQPKLSDVVSPEAATQYRIIARETIFADYVEGKISYMDAVIMAGEIEHPGDKADTFYLLMNYEKLKANPKLWMGFPEYCKVWFQSITATIFGIKGHLIMTKEPRYFLPLYLLMGLAGLGFLLRWRPRGGWLPFCLAATSLIYSGYFLYKINYNAYTYYGTPGVTLQGRYLFPLLGPFFVLFCTYLLSLFRGPRIRYALAAATALLFISYDFPWFLMHSTPEWFSWLPR